VGGFGFFMAFLRRMKLKKKDRIDEYYKKVLDIENRYETIATASDIADALSNLKKIKQEAFGALIDEKLVANESFNIFLGLCDSLIVRLEDKSREAAK